MENDQNNGCFYDFDAEVARLAGGDAFADYRQLRPGEIRQLETQGCRAADWSAVLVDRHTDLEYIRESRFSGEVRIGRFGKVFTIAGGIRKHSGIYRATLHRVVVGDDCLVENVKNCIANYIIGADTLIENVGSILVDRPATFGNGVEVSVLNETGGHEVTIHTRLTAHEAYIEAMYRHRPQIVQRIKALAAAYAATRRAPVGRIGRGVTIVDAGCVKNVAVGDYAEIEGAGRLKNGTVVSNRQARVHIGYGVVLDDFIIQSGCGIEDGTMLSRCYVGQSCKMGHAYTASDSLFFSNCQGENGEACALFAGPFTVTHHKSTLLIAGMFSFMNAGSGSNQSNHLYKLGPIHQGSMERGAKTSSDSYILWPARIGAFSLVMGRHVGHIDTSDLPFSYLIEKQGMTYLAPAVSLKSVGTIRDAQKWSRRDGRTGPGRLDCINFNLLSPYTMQKALRGMALLGQLREVSGATSDTYTFYSARITRASLERALELYDMAVVKFLGNSLIQRLQGFTGKTGEELRRHLLPTHPAGGGEWVDLQGLIAPQTEIDRLCDDLLSGAVNDIEALNARFATLHAAYYEMEWTWAYEELLRYFKLDARTVTADQLIGIVRRWKRSVVALDEMVYADAKKEFLLSAKSGSGAADGTRLGAERDFEQVRGDFESNPFVAAVMDHIRKKTALGDAAVALLDKVQR